MKTYVALALALVLAACHPHATSPIVTPKPVAPPVAVSHATPEELARFETVWQEMRSCLDVGLPAELTGLDLRDALPLVLELERNDRFCFEWKPITAALPPRAEALAAAVGALTKLWSETSYGDDTGRHLRFAQIQEFANALRDADDMRVAERRAAGLEPHPFGARRLPALELRAAADAPPIVRDDLGDALAIEHVVRVGRSSLDGYARSTIAGDRGGTIAWTTHVADKTRDLFARDGGREVLVDRNISNQLQRIFEIGAGDHRAIVVYGDGYTIYTSADAGKSWRVEEAKLDATEIPGDPRGVDLVAQAPRRWIHIGGDGVIAPPVALHGDVHNSSWSCATPDTLWSAVGKRHEGTAIAWLDRAGRHGEIPFAGYGGWGCAGHALLAQQRCTTDRARCDGAPSIGGHMDLTSDGVVAAAAVGHVVVIERTGEHPSTHYARMPERATLQQVTVVGETPIFLVNVPEHAEDEKVAFDTEPSDDERDERSRNWSDAAVRAFVEGKEVVSAPLVSHDVAPVVVPQPAPAPHAAAFATAWRAARTCMFGAPVWDADLARARSIQLALGGGACVRELGAALAVAREGGDADAGYHLAWRRAALAIDAVLAISDERIATKLAATEAAFAGGVGAIAGGALAKVPMLAGHAAALTAPARGAHASAAIDHAVTITYEVGGKTVVSRFAGAGVEAVPAVVVPAGLALPVGARVLAALDGAIVYQDRALGVGVARTHDDGLVHPATAAGVYAARRASGEVDVIWQPATDKKTKQVKELQWLAIADAKPLGAPQVLGRGDIAAFCGTAAGLWWIDEAGADEHPRVMFSAARGATRKIGEVAVRGGEIRACTADHLVVAVGGTEPALVRCARAAAACDPPVTAPGAPGTRVFADLSATGELQYAFAIGGSSHVVIGPLHGAPARVVDIAGELVGAVAFHGVPLALVIARPDGLAIEGAQP